MTECSICFCDVDVKVFSCGHGMHHDCMKGMSNKVCPICRQEIKEWPKELEENVIENAKKYNADDVEHAIDELRTEIEHEDNGVSQEEIERQLARAKQMMEMSNTIKINTPLVMECIGCDEKRASRALALANGNIDYAVNLILANEDEELANIIQEERARAMLDVLFQMVSGENNNIMTLNQLVNGGVNIESVTLDGSSDEDDLYEIPSLEETI